MPRANRCFLLGQVHHLTHRCHNRQFLFKFARGRDAYREGLREGSREFGVWLLDYSETKNHVDLPVFTEETEAVSRLMQMVEKEFAQAYNRRKGRKGA